MHVKRVQLSGPIFGAAGVFALALIALYVVLSVAAVSCLPDASPPAGQAHPHQPGHHNQNGLTHSPLCAWACQADLSTSLMPSRVGLPVLLLLIGFLLPTSWSPQLADLRSGCSRSPPLSGLSR